MWSVLQGVSLHQVPWFQVQPSISDDTQTPSSNLFEQWNTAFQPGTKSLFKASFYKMTPLVNLSKHVFVDSLVNMLILTETD